MGILAPLAAVGAAGAITAAYLVGYSHGTAEHEAAAQAAALKRTQQALREHQDDLATADRLMDEAKADSEKRHGEAQARIGRINAALQKAVRDRKRAEAAHAKAVKDREQAFDALAATPDCPTRKEPKCALDSTLPSLR